MSRALTRRRSLQQVEVVGGGAATAAEDGDDDAEADRDLGGGDHQREEHDHLAADVVELRWRTTRT